MAANLDTESTQSFWEAFKELVSSLERFVFDEVRGAIVLYVGWVVLQLEPIAQEHIEKRQ